MKNNLVENMKNNSVVDFTKNESFDDINAYVDGLTLQAMSLLKLEKADLKRFNDNKSVAILSGLGVNSKALTSMLSLHLTCTGLTATVNRISSKAIENCDILINDPLLCEQTKIIIIQWKNLQLNRIKAITKHEIISQNIGKLYGYIVTQNSNAFELLDNMGFRYKNLSFDEITTKKDNEAMQHAVDNFIDYLGVRMVNKGRPLGRTAFEKAFLGIIENVMRTQDVLPVKQIQKNIKGINKKIALSFDDTFVDNGYPVETAISIRCYDL